jgi:prepilin-type processing-associated H-X9-DG protein
MLALYKPWTGVLYWRGGDATFVDGHVGWIGENFVTTPGSSARI